MRTIDLAIVRRRTLAVLAGLAVAAPAVAGVRYTAVTHTSHGDRSIVAVETEGAGTRVEFRDRNADFRAGDYLVTADGGDTLYWVEPRKRRYSAVDLEALAQLVGRVMQGIPGVFWQRIDEPRVEKLFEAAGPVVLGHPTRHLRFLMTYRERSRVTLPAKHGATSTREETWNQVVHDVWVTDAVAVPRIDTWMKTRFRTFYPDLDRFLAAEASLDQGFPLRSETVRVAASRDLDRTRVWLSRAGSSIAQQAWIGAGFPAREIEWYSTLTEVTALELTGEPIAGERFQPPAGFSRREPGG